MNIETEQLLAAAARVQLAWHYARLLSPLLQREQRSSRGAATTPSRSSEPRPSSLR